MAKYLTEAAGRRIYFDSVLGRLVVMANIGYQLNRIYTHLGDKPLGMPIRTYIE